MTCSQVKSMQGAIIGSAKSESSPRLELYRCTKCRRAFFNADRRESHFLNAHGTKYRMLNGLMNVKMTGKGKLGGNRNQNWRQCRNSRCFHEAVFHTLLINWPPEKAYDKMCAKHKISGHKAKELMKKMLSSEYSQMLHASENALDHLLEEYAKDSVTTRQRIEDISQTTGLSPRFIKLWFLWRRNRGHHSTGNELLNNSFFEQPYPSDEVYQTLASETGLLFSQIQLRFRLMRAKYQVLEFKEVQEKVLWAWFMKNPGSLVDPKEVKEVASLVGMKIEDVQTIFEHWRILWFTADEDIRSRILDQARDICTLLGFKLNAGDGFPSALEKARSSQKILGIPTRCKILKRKCKRSGIVTKSGYVSFNSYTPKRSSSDYQRKSEDKTPPGKKDSFASKVGNIKDVKEVGTDTSSCELELQSDPAVYGSLKVQCDVLKSNDTSSLQEKPHVEHDLYSLFNIRPASRSELPRQIKQQRHLSEVENRDGSDHDWAISSTSENEIDAVSSNEDQESEESESSDDDFHLMMPEPSNRPIIVIDLTMDSDSEDLEEEVVLQEDSLNSENEDGSKSSDAYNHKQGSVSVGETSETSEMETIRTVKEDCSDEEVDASLMICESDDAFARQLSEGDVAQSVSPPELYIDEIVNKSDEVTVLPSVKGNSRPDIDKNVKSIPTMHQPVPWRRDFARDHSRVRHFSMNNSPRRTMFIAPLPLGRRRRNSEGERKRFSKHRKRSSSKPPLLVKSIMEGRKSAYFDFKRKLH